MATNWNGTGTSFYNSGSGLKEPDMMFEIPVLKPPSGRTLCWIGGLGVCQPKTVTDITDHMCWQGATYHTWLGFMCSEVHKQDNVYMGVIWCMLMWLHSNGLSREVWGKENWTIVGGWYIFITQRTQLRTATMAVRTLAVHPEQQLKKLARLRHREDQRTKDHDEYSCYTHGLPVRFLFSIVSLTDRE